MSGGCPVDRQQVCGVRRGNPSSGKLGGSLAFARLAGVYAPTIEARNGKLAKQRQKNLDSGFTKVYT